MIKKTIEGFLAGIMIAIGGTVYVASENKVVGAVFFSIALLTICMKGYSLFTGKVGFLPLSHTKEDVSALLWGLLGNFLATLVCGVLIALTFPSYHTAAEAIAQAKLSQALYATLIRAVFCGVLMYAAVSIFRENKSSLAIFFGIPTFILAGFEHSIADMFYLALGYAFSLKSVLFIVVVLIGNALGAVMMSGLRLLGEKSLKKSDAVDGTKN
ncbi:MAG: formate/nitrite transporter family protein [Clostridia bacterium]|nr:formate/nitrite transporter family protein [Clostridia bacterium]